MTDIVRSSGPVTKTLSLAPGRHTPPHLLPYLGSPFTAHVWVWDFDHAEYLLAKLTELREVGTFSRMYEDSFREVTHAKLGKLYVVDKALFSSTEDDEDPEELRPDPVPTLMLCPGRYKPYHLLPYLESPYTTSTWVWDDDHLTFLLVELATLKDESLHHSMWEHDEYVCLYHNRFGKLYVAKGVLPIPPS